MRCRQNEIHDEANSKRSLIFECNDKNGRKNFVTLWIDALSKMLRVLWYDFALLCFLVVASSRRMTRLAHGIPTRETPGVDERGPRLDGGCSVAAALDVPIDTLFLEGVVDAVTELDGNHGDGERHDETPSVTSV